MLKLAALAERLKHPAHDKANALDSLEVRNRDRTADLAPVLTDRTEARENELVRHVGEDIRDVCGRERGLDRLRHRSVVAGAICVAERGEDVAQAVHTEVVSGVEVNALELLGEDFIAHRGAHARGSGDGLHILRSGGLEVDDGRRGRTLVLQRIGLLCAKTLELSLLGGPAFLDGLRHDVFVALAGLNDGGNALALSVRSRLHGDGLGRLRRFDRSLLRIHDGFLLFGL